ncbi:JAB domain-containing protein [Lactiplantibacillus sp. WILCCON 0030]|uniref:JAB domain-containing protein n=1 Tax=Lactiplantibacillus brownii TaxID=3069269 RepID=A0ABU1AA80_9LACO|nr:JAB domain-containing protein [Lactiplantibacillus brownii]MDQ7937783.1 JAB domain-containing protein [Lactiplantibacillus brownii]
MSLLTGRTDDHGTQIHHLIQRYFRDFLDPSAAAAATLAFEGAYPAAEVTAWSRQPNSDPLWNSLLTALRCGRLLQAQPRIVLGQVYGSQQIGEQLLHDFAGLAQEQLLLICLDTKNQILKRQIVFQGTLNACPVHPREIFQAALLTNTARVVIAHNHPSGDCEPSGKDTEFTERLSAGGKLLGLPLLDSFVVGATDYFSFAEQGLLNCNTDSE